MPHPTSANRGERDVDRDERWRQPWQSIVAFSPLFCVLGAALLLGCGKPSGPTVNVILITLDTTRADALGVYGHPGGNSPNIDRLATDSAIFDLAIATSSLTPVSHASILTGLENHQHGLRVAMGAPYDRLPDDIPTIASLLQTAGYVTIGVGSSFTTSRHFGFEHGFDLFDDLPGVDVDTRMWDLSELQRRSDETVDIALTRVDGATQPYFLWLHLWDPHDPFRIPPIEDLPLFLPQTDGNELYMSLELYLAEVRYMDRQLGRLLDHLKQTGSYDDTLIILTADHGEGLGDHGWPYHQLVYQEQLRLPLLIKPPLAQLDSDRRGNRFGSLVRATDLLPTILDYLSLPIPPVAGQTLRPMIAAEPNEGTVPPTRRAFADALNEYDLNSNLQDERPLDDHLYCAMDDHWKLIYRPTRPRSSELYDLVSDPFEHRNEFANQPDIVADLLTQLAKLDPWMIDPPPFSPEPEASRALRELGYVGVRETVAKRNWKWCCPRHLKLFDHRGVCNECATPRIPYGVK